jgi:hypothetical protein
LNKLPGRKRRRREEVIDRKRTEERELDHRDITATGVNMKCPSQDKGKATRKQIKGRERDNFGGVWGRVMSY